MIQMNYKMFCFNNIDEEYIFGKILSENPRLDIVVIPDVKTPRWHSEPDIM